MNEVKLPAGQYWATLPSEDIAPVVRQKFDRFLASLEENGDLDVMRRAGCQYYGRDEEGLRSWTNEAIGSRGQARTCDANHWRASLSQAIAIALADPPGLMPVPRKTDHSAIQLAEMAKGVLTYYQGTTGQREGTDAVLRETVEMGEVYGWAWAGVWWDELAGEVTEELPEMGALPEEGGDDGSDPLAVQAVRLIMSGDIRAEPYLPTDVAFDVDSRGHAQPWRVLRRWVNKFELAATLEDPELAEQLRNLEPTDQAQTDGDLAGTRSALRNTDDIDTYELRYLPTAAVPRGRSVLIAGRDLLISDGPHKFGRDDFGLYPYRSSKRIGTGRGYARSWDALGVQGAINALGRIAYSNQYAFGLNVLVALEGSGIRAEQISEGLRIIFTARPDALQALSLAKTPSEVFEFRDTLIAESGRLLGLDALSMGTETRDLSGAAMALLDTRTQRALGPMASAAHELRRQLGLAIIRRAAEHPQNRMLPLLVGKATAPRMMEVNFQQLGDIAAVELEKVSPLQQSPAGRVEMASQLMASRGPDGKPAINAQQFIGVVKTGQLDPLTEGPMAELQLIRAQNEALMQGQSVPTLATDNHPLHIQEHLTVLASPEARSAPDMVALVTMHIQEHIGLWRTTDPALLAVLGIPPPPPPVVMGPGGAPMPAAPAGRPPTAGGGGPPPGSPAPADNMPSLPTNPATGEEYSPTGGVNV